MGAGDIYLGLFFGALSIGLYALTFGFPNLTVALSPAVFPRFVSTCLFVLSAILTVSGLRRRAAAKREGKEETKVRLELPFVRRFILLAVVSLVYLFLLEPIGYVLATPLCIAAGILIFGERRWPRVLLVSVISTAVLYAVFKMLFRVPLPRSPLW